MTKVGYLLIAIGFLAGALVCVIDETEVNWLYFLLALAGGIVGIVLVRVSKHRQTHEHGKLQAGIQQLESSLKRVVENMQRLEREKETIDVYDIRLRIDETFPADLAGFVDNRESITHLFGLQAYANVMSHFAAGERYLNRVWSASADGYVDEARAYILHASNQFLEALNQLQLVRAQAPVAEATARTA